MKFLFGILFLFVMCGTVFGETALTVTDVSETDAAIPYESVDVVSTNSAANVNGDVFFLLQNDAAGSTATVTFTAQKTTKTVPGYGPMVKANLAVSLSALQEKVVGPFPSTAWNNSSGLIILTTTGDGSASVDVAALRIPAS